MATLLANVPKKLVKDAILLPVVMLMWDGSVLLPDRRQLPWKDRIHGPTTSSKLSVHN
jgi:hypothetical protein